MHGKNSQTLSSLNELRFLLATTTDKPATALPPAEDAFKQHVLRAQYQVAVWCQSHIAKPVDMDPVGHGWHVNVEDELCPTMYKNESAPAEVRDVKESIKLRVMKIAKPCKPPLYWVLWGKL